MTVARSEAPERRELPPSMVERMTLILDAFPGRSARLTLEDVARITHLPRSTAHRILDQLLKLNWLEHSSFGYSLGQRALHLGGVVDDTSELRAAASAHLHSLMIRTGLTVHLAVLDEGRVHYLDKIGARFATAVPSRVGGYAPAHCTALGRAMLAWLPAEEVEERVGEDLRVMTGRTIADVEALHHELTRVRARHGLAFERGECFEDIACVAATVRGPEGPLGAISLVGDSSTPLERVAPLVLDAARKVSLELHPDLALGRPGQVRRLRTVTA
ncbi:MULTISPECIES: IclR family transcriptional regulator [unclassified Nocardioides]|uniref:IclR family transcriptional regulator n=1 Tax=unclassified Nocardioides TaxID=2615069 RepID=UPI002666B65B|nr:IclR family transcriptional regulator [Nocardioides sp. Arc9.136]WKN47011.1 IclR family transcriptional regulator [Nocardioides sp. Arc9.136]